MPGFRPRLCGQEYRKTLPYLLLLFLIPPVFPRTETDQKEICLEDEEEKYRIEFADKAARGITDDKQAKAAAEIFKGTWTKAKNKWGKTVDAYVIDEADREKYIERSVMVNMALLKKTWAEKAITGAKLRVIRGFLLYCGRVGILVYLGLPIFRMVGFKTHPDLLLIILFYCQQGKFLKAKISALCSLCIFLKCTA